MGDAAHAIVPFYGQGMNASFEDVLVLDQVMDREDNWSDILSAYQVERKADADAIADLAVDNFYEMRDHTANPVFVLKRQIELHLEENYPSYYSKYSMVTFREEMPYHKAMQLGRKQDRVLMEVAASVNSKDEVNYESLLKDLKELAN